MEISKLFSCVLFLSLSLGVATISYAASGNSGDGLNAKLLDKVAAQDKAQQEAPIIKEQAQQK